MTARRLLLTFAILLALIVIGLGAAFLWRAPLVEAAIRDHLRDRGVEVVELSVESVGLKGLAVEWLALGDRRELTVERLAVDYKLLPLEIQAVRLERPRLLLDLESGGPPLGSLQSLIPEEEDDGPPVRPPSLTVVEGTLDAATPLGPVKIALDGEAAGDGQGGIEGDFGYRATAGPASLAGNLTGQRRLDGGLKADLSIDEGAVSLTPAQAGLATEIAGLTGQITLSQPPDAGLQASGSLSLAALGLQNARFRQAELSFALDESRLQADGSLRAEDDGLRLRFTTRAQDFLGRPRISTGLSIGASAEAALFKLVAQPFATGEGTIGLSLAGELPPLSDALGTETGGSTAEQLLAWALGGALDGRFELAARNLSLPERMEGLSIAASGTLQLADGGALVNLAPGAGGGLATLDQTWLTGLGLPAEPAALLAEGLDFEIAEAEPLPPALLLRPVPAATEAVVDGRLALTTRGGGERPTRLAVELRQAIVTLAAGLGFLDLPDLRVEAGDLRLQGNRIDTLTLEGSLFGQLDDLETDLFLEARARNIRQDDLRAGGLAVSLPLKVALRDGAVETWIDQPGRIELARLSHASGLKLARPARLTLREGTVMASPPSAEGTGGDRFVHDLRLASGRLDLVLPQEGRPDLPIRLEPQRLRLIGEREGKSRYRGRLSFGGGALVLPSLEAQLEELAGTLNFAEGFRAPRAGFTGALSYRALPRLSLEGQAQRRGDIIEFEGAGTPSGEQLALQGFMPRFSGRYDLNSGRADFALTPLRLNFAPGGLQPSDLLPQYADITGMSGTLSAEAEGSWRDGSLTGTGALQLADVSFTREDITVTDLDLSLALDQLWPPRTATGQRLSIARIESAVPIEALQASFRLMPGDPVKAEIETLDFGLIGGRFSLGPTLVDPTATRHAATLQMATLDLETVFKLLEIEGLGGSGRLQGRLPVSVAGDTVVIKDGYFEADGPGVLSYRQKSDGPALPLEEEDDTALLQDPMALTLRALENFHYDKLAIGLDKEADGASAMRVQLEGKNPDLLDGYPFKLNINLSGDVSPVLLALERGLDLTQDLLGRSWTLQ